MDYKAVLNGQIETLQKLQEDNIKEMLGLHETIESAIKIARQINELVAHANSIN